MCIRDSFQCADVFDLLPQLERQGEKFDVVILDPPAFTKSRNSVKNAVKGYREINLRGLKPVSYTHLDVYKRQGVQTGALWSRMKSWKRSSA